MDDLPGREQARNHPDQQCGHHESRGLIHRDVPREGAFRRYGYEEYSEHVSLSNQQDPQFQQMIYWHSQERVFAFLRYIEGLASGVVSKLSYIGGCSDKHDSDRTLQAGQLLTRFCLGGQAGKFFHQEGSCNRSLIESCNIISVSQLPYDEPYYDLQVLDNNCYVTADGLIHHNSGKTWVGCGGICKNFWEFPKINQGYFAPTYPQIRDIFYPTVEEVAFDWGLKVKINESNKEVHFYSGRQYRGTTICRSMEKPDSIVGFKIGNALVDELDVMKMEKARQAWRKIIARMRYKVAGLRNGIDVTTTPEGYKFVFQQFVKAVRDKPELKTLYGLVQASTFDNEKNLPDDYIDSLLASYPPELIKAYLNGKFTNLTSGTIYHQFDRKLNHCNEEVQPGEPIFIGMDFNVGKMSAIVHVSRLGLPCAVGELVKGQDTPDMIRMIKERYWLYADGQYKPTREIYVYPDASGDSRKSVNASTTDIQLLRQAGFNVQVNAANPPVKDRINSMNAMFCNAAGVRRYKVNTLLCPVYAENLEQQVWDEKTGEPDKDGITDHTNDAGGYFIVKEFPIVKPQVGVSKIKVG
jgi:hypothetical protein